MCYDTRKTFIRFLDVLGLALISVACNLKFETICITMYDKPIVRNKDNFEYRKSYLIGKAWVFLPLRLGCNV